MFRSLKYLVIAAVMSLGPCLLGGLQAQVGQQDAEAKASSLKKIKNQDLDPEGEPAAFYKSENARYAVWRDRKGWHLLVKSGGGRAHQFKGRIRVEGGSFEQVNAYPVGRDLPPAAHWKLNRNKQEVTFNFKSEERWDGVRFRLSPNAARVVFALQIDGSDHPQLVYIGQKNQYPEILPVSLPAQPRQVKAGR